ncbi:PREDICTED: C-C motif chemokine 21 [Mesitornis unicolor]|uniref:C-C motif chemokine 21 n=1 Tax=Mesitornis unicolor TaxID=54374 RepID=UPI0005295381|nr:PREDICTED: C-C motif chemokine 21 [Mesitornis unicolor]
MALRLLLPLLLLAVTLPNTQAQGIGSSAPDCCLKHSQKAIPSNWVKSYSLQDSKSGCFLSAVVFTTKRNKKICASPTDPAVQKLMQSLDKKVKKKGPSPRPRGRSKRQKRQMDAFPTDDRPTARQWTSTDHPPTRRPRGLSTAPSLGGGKQSIARDHGEDTGEPMGR